MPEGPEIHVIAEDLIILNGQKLLRINNIAGKFAARPINIPKKPCIVQQPFSHGKNLFIPILCKNTQYYIHIHLMLRGKLSFVEPEKCILSMVFTDITIYLSDIFNKAVVNLLSAKDYENII